MENSNGKLPTVIKLIRKDSAPFNITELELNDDVVFGFLSGNTYAVSTTGLVQNVQELIVDYRFPKVCRIISFISGHNPELHKTIECYE